MAFKGGAGLESGAGRRLADSASPAARASGDPPPWRRG